MLLTVRWPLFARLEALLFFPIALMVASEIDQVQTIIDRWVGAALSQVGNLLRIPGQTIYWAAVAIVVTVPYFILLVVADRVLTDAERFRSPVRWSSLPPGHGPPCIFPGNWQKFVTPRPLPLPPANGCRLTWRWRWSRDSWRSCCISRPLWLGIRDQGDVAMRLLADREERAYQPGSDEQARCAQRRVVQQTADFRGWRPPRTARGPRGQSQRTPPSDSLRTHLDRRRRGYRLRLSATGISIPHRAVRVSEVVATPEVHGEPPTVNHGIPVVTQDNAPAMPLAPLAPAGAHGERCVLSRPPALPAVQRPTGVSASDPLKFSFVALASGRRARHLWSSAGWLAVNSYR